MDLGLKGKRAIVTGGSKGIGRRCADIFADEGAHVAICARNAGEVEATVAGLRAKGVTAHGAALDVSDKAWVVLRRPMKTCGLHWSRPCKAHPPAVHGRAWAALATEEMARDRGTCSRASPVARFSSWAATVPSPCRRATSAARHRQYAAS